MQIQGKNAIVTGARRGIGRAIVQEFAENGVNIWACASKYDEAFEEDMRQLSEVNNVWIKPVYFDLKSEDEIKQSLREVIAEKKPIDILVNNAGITKDGLLMKMSEDDFDAVVDTNLKGAFHCIRFVSRAMIRQRSGRIINISSVSGVLGNAGQANYAASKAGVIGLTKSAARELAGRKITVNAVAPGFIRTEMTAVLSEKVKEKAVLQIPMERFGEAEDVAQAVAFLASEQAGYITGQVLCVDGGMAM